MEVSDRDFILPILGLCLTPGNTSADSAPSVAALACISGLPDSLHANVAACAASPCPLLKLSNGPGPRPFLGAVLSVSKKPVLFPLPLLLLLSGLLGWGGGVALGRSVAPAVGGRGGSAGGDKGPGEHPASRVLSRIAEMRAERSSHWARRSRKEVQSAASASDFERYEGGGGGGSCERHSRQLRSASVRLLCDS